MRVGIGFDSHGLVNDRPLFLGGVEIPFSKGLLGHSDGDCLLHAVCDAMLGAIAGGDIGEHFPDTDPQWEGAPSSDFVASAAKMLKERKLSVVNLDAVIIASEPSITPHKTAIKEKISSLLGISEDQVNIKAKRPEGFEAVGSNVVASFAVVSVEER